MQSAAIGCWIFSATQIVGNCFAKVVIFALLAVEGEYCNMFPPTLFVIPDYWLGYNIIISCFPRCALAGTTIWDASISSSLLTSCTKCLPPLQALLCGEAAPLWPAELIQLLLAPCSSCASTRKSLPGYTHQGQKQIFSAKSLSDSMLGSLFV